MTPTLLLPILITSNTSIESIEVRAAKDLLHTNNFNHTKANVVSSNKVTTANNTIADWLTKIPSFSLNGQGGLYQSYSVRGMSRWRVKTSINNIPVLTDRRAGNSASFIDPSLIDTVSVIAGPSSMLYGSGAIAGVVSIESATFQAPTIKLSVTNSDNARSILVANGDDKTSFAFAHRLADEGLAANKETLYSAYEQSSASFTNKTKINDKYTLQTRWLGSLSKDVQKSSADDFLKKHSIYPEDIHSLTDISLVSDSWVLNIFDHYQNWDSKVTRVGKRENLTSYQSHTIGSSFYKEDKYLSAPIRYGFDWVSRVGVKINDKEKNYSSDSLHEKTLIDGSYQNFGSFIQGAFAVNEIEFNAGTRVDAVQLNNLKDSRTEQFLSGNISAKYDFNNQHSSLISVGNAFRFPTLTELYFNGVTPRGVTLGNQNLKTESSTSYELTHSIKFNEVEFKGVYFKTRLNNYIERISLNENTRSYINLDKAKISGLELSAAYMFDKNIKSSLSYSTQTGENEVGNTLNDISPTKMSFITEVNLDNFQFITDIYYRGKHSEVGPAESTLASVISANINTRWFINEELEISMGVTNLLNKLYRTTADEDAPFTNERRIKLNVSWHRF